LRSLLTLCERGKRGHPQICRRVAASSPPTSPPAGDSGGSAVAADGTTARARRSSKAISDVKVKTDQVDARMLAQLLRVGLIPEAQIRQEHRRLAATSEIVCQVHATLGIAARRGSANG